MAKKILVVDDDDGILEAIQLVLEEEGFTVETTPKGDETFTKIRSFQPDLILLDVLMSGKDGREICKKIKADKAFSVPIVMISAHPFAKTGAIACGADDFIAKPFETDELLKKVIHYTK